MFAVVFQPVTQIPGEVMTKAGTTLIESGVLGTLLVVSILANVALVWLCFRVMNKRVEDTKKNADLSEKMVTTFTEVGGTLDSMESAMKMQANALQSLTTTMSAILMSLMARQGNVPQSGTNQQPPGNSNPTGGT